MKYFLSPIVWALRPATTYGHGPRGKRLLTIIQALVLLTAGSTLSTAWAEKSGAPLKLIELFTSHGCSSCPPADKLLGELLEADPELMALEYHVDYWNSLIHGSAGSFTDPFSNADYSQRQREYSVAGLDGRPGVYTPQSVVNGVNASVGSNKRHILRALAEGRTQALTVSVDQSDTANELRVAVQGDASQLAKLDGTDISVVWYQDQATTAITGGENKSRELVNHHIVLDTVRLGEVSADGALEYAIATPQADHGCVVLIQEGALTPVYAAAECP